MGRAGRLNPKLGVDIPCLQELTRAQMASQTWPHCEDACCQLVQGADLFHDVSAHLSENIRHFAPAACHAALRCGAAFTSGTWARLTYSLSSLYTLSERFAYYPLVHCHILVQGFDAPAKPKVSNHRSQS